LTGLLAKAEATVLIGTRVKSISKNIYCPDKNVVVYETSDNQEVAVDNFDYVLVGLPLYEGVLGARVSWELISVWTLKAEMVNPGLITI